MANGETRIHETDFCAEVSKWADQFFATTDSPFSSSGIEGYGTGPQSRKRKDLRFYDRSSGQLAICGEVRLPSTAKGHSAYDAELIENAFHKAENSSVQYFFTWDVNRFVLWDRALWKKPLLERRVRQWPLGLQFLRDAAEVGRPENLEHIRTKFLPALLLDLGRIYRGQFDEWPMPPDDLFIHSLESRLDWPITVTRAHLAHQSESSREFDNRLLQWMLDQDWLIVRKDAERWSQALDRAAQSLVHVLVNRLIFYQALRARFPKLPALQLKGARTPEQAYAALRRLFEKAVDTSGDYEPLFYPHEQDWAGRLVFEGHGALDAWNATLRGIEGYDFKAISSDVVGKVFQRLVSPEERHRWGQHFTGDDVVDLINSFCVRKGDDAVLDPACGSGSFLVRAYYRKRWLDSRKPHVEILGQLFGCDIALYPAHLATLNLAAREINDEANYPRIARRDFFDVNPGEPFCEVPPDHTQISLPVFDAVVGNPPYVRQERIESKQKDAEVVLRRWPGLRLSGRSDQHCYFWPAASAMLAEGGHFGFLTSSSWLDVEYGVPAPKVDP
jgi:tRNA1(Val) A37 N6-methylase TrmN6